MELTQRQRQNSIHASASDATEFCSALMDSAADKQVLSLMVHQNYRFVSKTVSRSSRRVAPVTPAGMSSSTAAVSCADHPAAVAHARGRTALF
mmetsp:Transcript_15650/g.47203  ORF Transcript_15650/g.47203 Transcript_15650/m.47203 type:complete len:93 (+) Transcript_15650:1481-1759(+)